MDHTATIITDSGNLAEIIDALLALDGPICPMSVSDAEDEPRIPLNTQEGQKYYLDRISSEFSFLFFARQGTFMFMPSPGLGWDVSITEIFEADAIELMQAVAEYPITFAFACEWNELLFLNQVKVTLSYGTLEAWVGQDIKRYLPGLYWITVLPIARAEHWDELAELAAETDGMTLRRTRYNIYLQLYERAADWHDRQLTGRIAALLDSPVFDKAVILSQIDGTEDFLTMSDKLDQWP